MDTMRRSPEHYAQVAVIKWARAQSAAWPALRMLYAVPNGGDRHAAVARKLKAEGVRRGVPDLVLAYPNEQGYHGLYLELKAEGGRVSREQREWLECLREAGYAAAIAYGSDAAIAVICDYIYCRLPGGNVHVRKCP